MSLPLLADFAVRLSGGMAALLAATRWRDVPLAYFRTLCQVMLGLGVLAALGCARSGAGPTAVGLATAIAVLAFLASVAWGLGLPRLGLPLTVGISLTAVVTLLLPGIDLPASAFYLRSAGLLSSACVLGATFDAMLLGHHYLTAPNMSIEPLKRFVRFMAIGLIARATISALALGPWLDGPGPAGVPWLFLAIRWGMGFVGVGLATLLAWKTVAIRSTQSATGILYIAVTLLLFGELSAGFLGPASSLPS